MISRRLRDERHSGAIAPRLWDDLGGIVGPEISGKQLRSAAAALAVLDPANRRWSEIAPAISPRLVHENPLLIGAWREAFQPVSRELLPSLRAAYSAGRPRRSAPWPSPSCSISPTQPRERRPRPKTWLTWSPTRNRASSERFWIGSRTEIEPPPASRHSSGRSARPKMMRRPDNGADRSSRS